MEPDPTSTPTKDHVALVLLTILTPNQWTLLISGTHQRIFLLPRRLLLILPRVRICDRIPVVHSFYSFFFMPNPSQLARRDRIFQTGPVEDLALPVYVEQIREMRLKISSKSSTMKVGFPTTIMMIGRVFKTVPELPVKAERKRRYHDPRNHIHPWAYESPSSSVKIPVTSLVEGRGLASGFSSKRIAFQARRDLQSKSNGIIRSEGTKNRNIYFLASFL